MIVSVAEANGLICPRTIPGAPAGCVGNGCAVWRWFGIRPTNGSIDNSGEGLSLASSTVALPEGHTRVGYCGFGGRP